MSVFFNLWILAVCLLISPLVCAEDKAGQDTNAIVLAVHAQKTAGIETMTLESANYRSEIVAYGKAIATQAVLALHHQYLQNLTEYQRIAARFQQSEQAIKRQQELFQEGVSAKRNLQEQQAQWQSDKAQLNAIQLQIQSMKEEVQLSWGDKLSAWILSEQTKSLAPFISGQQVLLQITLPSNRQWLEKSGATIFVESSGARSKAQPAQIISDAPQTDAGNQGNSYFFQTRAGTIKAGMNLTAWLPEQHQQLGVIVPKTALVWAMDQVFVFIKTDEETFNRRQLSDYTATNEGYFVTNTVRPGDEIVSTGAQMLLSEALRGQIPDDD